MAQHDYIIANQGFPSFRSDLNNALVQLLQTIVVLQSHQLSIQVDFC